MTSRLATTAAMLALASLAVCGCGRETGNVSGRVTFQGKPVTDARIMFSDPEYGTYFTAPLDANGRFEMRSAEGPGLWVGPYKVTILPKIEDPPIGPAPPPKPRPGPNIPAKYRDPKTTPLSVEVQEKNEPFNFDLEP
ncbi:MAG: carboxypeptidase-like regulatory domain-containing protein [Thermoguttaceae bacterium]|nr:carboxypeptidase-like regulatory domain-containing protein [Thermoguttaceae bacterium]